MQPVQRDLLAVDREQIWHPYTSMRNPLPVYQVASARGVRLKLSDGRELIDGMSSWWTAIHGYNHPALNAAATAQIEKVSHVMFGGITHEPAITLAEQIFRLAPRSLDRIFYSDSGSVSVEVAIKMAIQFWFAQDRPRKTRLLTIRSGYHGDTFGAMSVCDPDNGMHGMFGGVLPQHIFVPAPRTRFDEPMQNADIEPVRDVLEQQSDEIAAIIVEPVVQGAGGMRIYSPQVLTQLRALCDQHDVLLIFDEIATGFGRTGKMFACEHAGVAPDIMCIGKALTGGYLSLAATLANRRVSDGISAGDNDGVFMHGPTFMGNPLACAVASASLSLLESGDWQTSVRRIEAQLKSDLSPLADHPAVEDVRVLGAIGVIECHTAIDVAKAQAYFVSEGVWIRPFGKLLYIMPPYIIDDDDLSQLTTAMAGLLDQ